VNTKSLYAAIAVFAFLLAGIGFARFSVDLWNYLHASSAVVGTVPAGSINYGGLYAGLTLAAISVAFLFLHLRKKH
jgi:hypothetical protein